RVAATSNVKFKTDIDDVSKRLPKDAEIHIYRIIQESLNNILKHSGAATAHIELKQGVSELRIEIFDDGRGFEQSTAPKIVGGLGLASIAERVRLLGGQHEFLSTLGKGARLSIRIPIKS